MTFSQALQHCKKQRYFVNPNDGFRRQLIQWSREVKSKSSKVSDTNASALPNEENKIETRVSAPTSGLAVNGFVMA